MTTSEEFQVLLMAHIKSCPNCELMENTARVCPEGQLIIVEAQGIEDPKEFIIKPPHIDAEAFKHIAGYGVQRKPWSKRHKGSGGVDPRGRNNGKGRGRH